MAAGKFKTITMNENTLNRLNGKMSASQALEKIMRDREKMIKFAKQLDPKKAPPVIKTYSKINFKYYSF